MNATEIRRASTAIADRLTGAAQGFEAVIATMTPVVTFDRESGRPVDEVLDTRNVELPQRVPLLDSHNRETIESIIGSVVDLRRLGRAIVGQLVFSTDARAQQARKLVAGWHLTDISVGARVHKFEMLRPGESRSIAGIKFVATNRPMKVITEWSIREASLVPIGADENAKVKA